VPRSRLPAAALEYFRAIGKRHGASGGKRAAANMTPAERKARATKASRAAAAARTAKVKIKKAKTR